MPAPISGAALTSSIAASGGAVLDRTALAVGTGCRPAFWTSLDRLRLRL